jgi:hypothetical protein
MASEIQKHIEQHNADYVKNFSYGKLPLPPAKKYLVGTLRPLPFRHIETRICPETPLQ